MILYSKSDILIDVSQTLTTTDDYTVSDNIITLKTSSIIYELTGTVEGKNIIVSSSCTLKLNTLTLASLSTISPIIINENVEVSLILSGASSLTDTSTNEKDGVIYLNKGSKLTISGDGILNIIPNKCMAINGTEDTSLIFNGGILNIKKEENEDNLNVGGIYLRKEIIFNDGIFNFNIPITVSEGKPPHAIDTEGSITIKKGTYNIISKEGKALQAEGNLYIGDKNTNDNNLLNINIYSSDNEGIEAKGIEVYSGTISIKAGGDGINAANDACNSNCRGNCDCYIKFEGGEININSEEDGIDSNGDITITGGQIVVLGASSSEDQPIDQDGLLTISDATVLAGGSYSMGGVKATTSQTSGVYIERVPSGSNLKIYDEYNNEIMNLIAPKEVNYIYFTYPGNSFSMKLNDVEIQTIDPSSLQLDPQQPGGPGRPGDPGDNPNNPAQPPDFRTDINTDSSSDIGKDSSSFYNFERISYILFLFGIIII